MGVGWACVFSKEILFPGVNGPMCPTHTCMLLYRCAVIFVETDFKFDFSVCEHENCHKRNSFAVCLAYLFVSLCPSNIQKGYHCRHEA